ncbi:MAG: protein kinase [Alphaproteobacteria bacterium]|nr:protein kinase [Alphaproteobacteria bacterium]
MKKTPHSLQGGRYRIERVLGVGGMSVVLLAFDTRMGVHRAIKLLHRQFAQRAQIRERFENEAYAQAALRHPNILMVHDVIEDAAGVYLVMELAEKGSLAGRVEKDGPMSPREVARIGAVIARALKVAHDEGLVHRDIKPENILVDRHDVLKIADFGIARGVPRNANMTRTGMVMGTWAFMPPEQRESAKEVDGRADIYAWGASLWFLLTGRRPSALHNAESHGEALAGIPDALAEVIKKATRFRFEDRYEDGEQMAADLDAIVAALPDAPIVERLANPLTAPDLAEDHPDSDIVSIIAEDRDLRETLKPLISMRGSGSGDTSLLFLPPPREGGIAADEPSSIPNLSGGTIAPIEDVVDAVTRAEPRGEPRNLASLARDDDPGLTTAPFDSGDFQALREDAIAEAGGAHGDRPPPTLAPSPDRADELAAQIRSTRSAPPQSVPPQSVPPQSIPPRATPPVAIPQDTAPPAASGGSGRGMLLGIVGGLLVAGVIGAIVVVPRLLADDPVPDPRPTPPAHMTGQDEVLRVPLTVTEPFDYHAERDAPDDPDAPPPDDPPPATQPDKGTTSAGASTPPSSGTSAGTTRTTSSGSSSEPRVIKVLAPTSGQDGGSGAGTSAPPPPQDPVGIVQVRTVPSAHTVRVGGKTLERSGAGYVLPEGSHVLEVQSANGESTRIPVVVRADATVEICYSFDTNSACGTP